MEEIEDYFRHLAETSDDLQHTEERPAFFLYDYDRFFEATVKAPVVLFMHPFTGGFADSKGDNKLDLQRPQWSIWMQIDETKVNDASRVIRETKRIANKILARIKWHLEEDPSMAYCDLLRYYDLNDVEYKIDEIYHDNWTGFRVIVPLAVPAEMEGGNWDGSPLLLESGAPLDAEFELNGEESQKLSDLDLAEELEDEALFYISQNGADFGVTWAMIIAGLGELVKDGEDGTDGDDGASAYQIAVANGFEGTEAEWVESLKGEPGADGGSSEFQGFFATNPNSPGGTGQIIQPNTWTKVTGGSLGMRHSTRTEDDSRYWYDSQTDIFQPDKAGWYELAGLVTYINIVDAKIIVGVYKNGSLEGLLGRGTNAIDDWAGFGGTFQVEMNGTTDYVELYTYHSNATPVNIANSAKYTHFSGKYLRPLEQ